MQVCNMESPQSGRKVANQFIINDDEGNVYFQSYQTIIVKQTPEKTYLDRRSWDCSVTTSKYRNIFLFESTKETRQKLAEGIYELADLN